MSYPRYPARLGDKDSITEFYPRELTESDGKLFIYKEGVQIPLNPDASASEKGLAKLSNNIPGANSGSGSAGTSTDVSRADHIHPTDTSRAAKTDLDNHIDDKSSNPHKVTAEQVGLGNVPNVTTNDQTPTFTEADLFTNIESGEKLSVIMGKIRKAIANLMSHLNNKLNPHEVTLSQLGVNATAEELNYVDGATDNIQTQLNDLSDEIDGKMPNVAVTAEDNGKFMRVVNGAWTASAIAYAEEAKF